MLIPVVVAELRIHVWFRHVNSVSVLAETSTCIYEISADLEENSKSDRFFNVLGIFEMGKSAKVKSFVASWVILSMKFWQALLEHFIIVGELWTRYVQLCCLLQGFIHRKEPSTF